MFVTLDLGGEKNFIQLLRKKILFFLFHLKHKLGCFLVCSCVCPESQSRKPLVDGKNQGDKHVQQIIYDIKKQRTYIVQLYFLSSIYVLKQDGVASLLADPPWCNSNNMRKSTYLRFTTL